VPSSSSHALDSVWLTDYKKGSLSRIPVLETVQEVNRISFGLTSLPPPQGQQICLLPTHNLTDWQCLRLLKANYHLSRLTPVLGERGSSIKINRDRLASLKSFRSSDVSAKAGAVSEPTSAPAHSPPLSRAPFTLRVCDRTPRPLLDAGDAIPQERSRTGLKEQSGGAGLLIGTVERCHKVVVSYRHDSSF
jgi:hypothetical protein